MLSYNDYLAGTDTPAFVEQAVEEHRASELYKTAVLADRYYHLENPTIMRYQKVLANLAGRAVADSWSPNNKVPSNWFFYFTSQAVGHLLGNGVFFEKESTKKRLGKTFDREMVRLASEAKVGGASFAFWTGAHLDTFSLRDFVPLYEEESGDLSGGIRFQPHRDSMTYTLFLPDNIIRYRKKNGEEIRCTEEILLHGKARPRIFQLSNTLGQSDLCGNRYVIDAYDLMASGLVNNADEGNFIYWILRNCDGMNEADDAQFLEQLRRFHFAHADGDDGSGVESHVVETPFEAHAAALDRLERQLYTNFMAVDVRSIAAGSRTATEIRAAYEPLNAKTDLFEYETTLFIEKLLEHLGIEDTPVYKRSQIVNQLEETEMILAAADYLDEETVLRKLPWISVDEVRAILDRRGVSA
ncbi:MAG: phage portal protein [Clostridia bacterium]|nr:phage portal protein [Clostridia bacterium]